MTRHMPPILQIDKRAIAWKYWFGQQRQTTSPLRNSYSLSRALATDWVKSMICWPFNDTLALISNWEFRHFLNGNFKSTTYNQVFLLVNKQGVKDNVANIVAILVFLVAQLVLRSDPISRARHFDNHWKLLHRTDYCQTNFWREREIDVKGCVGSDWCQCSILWAKYLSIICLLKHNSSVD